jgi:hypothetical protein
MSLDPLWIVDPAPDALDFFTIRMADGTPSGDTSEEPIATVYHWENATTMAAAPDMEKVLIDLLSLIDSPQISIHGVGGASGG